MSQTPEALRFSFANTGKANEAKTELEKKYPQIIITITEHANMIIASTRSITFDARIENEVTNLGGLVI